MRPALQVLDPLCSAELHLRFRCYWTPETGSMDQGIRATRSTWLIVRWLGASSAPTSRMRAQDQTGAKKHLRKTANPRA